VIITNNKPHGIWGQAYMKIGKIKFFSVKPATSDEQIEADFSNLFHVLSLMANTKEWQEKLGIESHSAELLKDGNYIIIKMRNGENNKSLNNLRELTEEILKANKSKMECGFEYDGAAKCGIIVKPELKKENRKER
jgi:hypothetical protein